MKLNAIANHETHRISKRLTAPDVYRIDSVLHRLAHYRWRRRREYGRSLFRQWNHWPTRRRKDERWKLFHRWWFLGDHRRRANSRRTFVDRHTLQQFCYRVLAGHRSWFSIGE